MAKCTEWLNYADEDLRSTLEGYISRKETEPKVSYSNFYDPKRFERAAEPKLPEIKRVVFNEPATIVFWSDNTKTVVKCQDGDIYDPEKGLAMAIAKKYLGNKGSYCNEFKKWLPVEAAYPNVVIPDSYTEAFNAFLENFKGPPALPILNVNKKAGEENAE